MAKTSLCLMPQCIHSQLATRVPHLGLCSPVGPWAFMLKNSEP